jgi:hypothetical protein
VFIRNNYLLRAPLGARLISLDIRVIASEEWASVSCIIHCLPEYVNLLFEIFQFKGSERIESKTALGRFADSREVAEMSAAILKNGLIEATKIAFTLHFPPFAGMITIDIDDDMI